MKHLLLEQYHGVNPQAEGAQAVSYFWGLMTAGCLVGMILLKLIRQQTPATGFGGIDHSAVTSRFIRKQGCFANRLSCYRIQYFHDVLYRLLIGAELGFTASRLICREFYVRLSWVEQAGR